MPDEATGPTGGGPPTFPGETPGSAPPPPAPPSYPDPPSVASPPLRSQYPPPSFDGPAGVPYASWGIRLGGWLIDGVIFAVVQVLLGAAFRRTNTLTVHMVMTRNGVVQHNTFSFLALIITAILFIAYSTIFCGGPRGQTVGMMAVGVRIVREETNGAVGYGRACGRALLEEVLRPTVVIWILDMLFPLWDQKRQTLHDKAVGTVVLRVRNAG